MYLKKTLRGFLFLTLLAFFCAGNPVFAAMTWTAQTSGTSNTLNGVYFVDANTGWAVGNGGTIRTTSNGGSAWSSQTSGISSTLTSVSFISASKGWIAGNSGRIRVTTNGGTTWTAQTSGTSNTLNSIKFIDANTGWAVGNSGTILATSNGGANWSAQTSGNANDVTGISAIDSSHAWVVLGSGAILATTDGGTNWVTQVSDTGNPLTGVSFVDVNHGWAVGTDGSSVAEVLVTTNGGTTWTQQVSNAAAGDVFNGVSFVNATTGWAVGYNSGSTSGLIFATTDGGTTWTQQVFSTNASLNGVFFFSANTGWIVGGGGVIINGLNPVTPPVTSTGGSDKKIPPPAPRLTVIKKVINDNGGKAAPSDFSISVKIYGNNIAGSPASGQATGRMYALDDTGTFTVREDAFPGYAATFSGDCDSAGKISLDYGDVKTCVITDDDLPPPQPPLANLPPAPSFSSPEASTTQSLPGSFAAPQAISDIFDMNLDIGDRNDDVMLLQQLLAQDKDVYPEGFTTGYYGSFTQKAVAAFQKKYGIPQVGRVGPVTRAKLQEVFGTAFEQKLQAQIDSLQRQIRELLNKSR